MESSVRIEKIPVEPFFANKVIISCETMKSVCYSDWTVLLHYVETLGNIELLQYDSKKFIDLIKAKFIHRI